MTTAWPSGTPDGGASPSAVGRPVRETVEVAREDLVVTQEAQGMVEFSGSREITASRAGTITWLPDVGTVLTRGDTVLRTDDQPVVLFLGETPLYRTLDGSGLRGPDVDVVAQNLVALGHLAAFPPGDVTGPRFAAAVSRWRTANGLRPVELVPPDGPGTPDPQSGQGAGRAAAGAGASAEAPADAPDGEGAEVPVSPDDDPQAPQASPDGVPDEPPAPADGSAPPAPAAETPPAPITSVTSIQTGEAVVLPEDVRVSAVLSQLGDPAEGAAVLRVTSTRKVVRLSADQVPEAAVQQGGEVTVVLPGGAEVPGTVAEVGTSGEAGDASATVVVEVADQEALSGVDGGPVTVRIVTARRDQVLAVPPAALLALREGGHALQLEDGTLVPVETGMFTDARVEVSGDAVHEGLRVVTAS
ncbi:hypothetical protein [Sanguibacter keddieii]|uniref:hypothetical protein n=1 Tax=Sanguibacter keddieii TaxID=60920 RepID=UPI00117C03DE|nr:hypothetical protein [Sanguibacter keddieii]